jgi:hypothetical protein
MITIQNDPMISSRSATTVGVAGFNNRKIWSRPVPPLLEAISVLLRDGTISDRKRES